jgi:hypothetical protein
MVESLRLDEVEVVVRRRAVGDGELGACWAAVVGHIYSLLAVRCLVETISS